MTEPISEDYSIEQSNHASCDKAYRFADQNQVVIPLIISALFALNL